MDLQQKNKRKAGSGILILIFLLFIALLVIYKLISINPENLQNKKQLVLFEIRNIRQKYKKSFISIKYNNKMIYNDSIASGKAFQKNIYLKPGNYNIYINDGNASLKKKDVIIKKNQRYEWIITLQQDNKKPLKFENYKLSEDILTQ